MEGINKKYIKPYLDWKSGEYQVLYSKGLAGEIAYGSHQPVLIKLLNTITKGDVIEFGMGEYSTHVMHYICKQQGRNMLSLETDQQWIDKFKEYNGLLIEPGKLKEYDFFKRKFSIALVDGQPLKFRQVFIELMNVDYFIVHDTEPEWRDLYDWNFSGFKNVYNFTDIIPHTTVLSNEWFSL